MTRNGASGDHGTDIPGHDPGAYGDLLGARYDSLYPQTGLETQAAVGLIAELAQSCPGRSVLEFGVGTGRLAIPLRRRGLRVAGIEASHHMVAALRDKDPRAEIDVVVGDYLTARVPGAFSVVVLVFNNVLDERGLSAQLAIFENAAGHLEPGGYFVVEAFVLDDRARDGNWKISPRYVGESHVELQMSRFDIETNTLERTLVHLLPEGAKFITVRDTYAGPGELDIMAHVHGFRRIGRYSGWSREPFNAASGRHISIYQWD